MNKIRDGTIRDILEKPHRVGRCRYRRNAEKRSNRKEKRI